jgi:hypothetical protein
MKIINNIVIQGANNNLQYFDFTKLTDGLEKNALVLYVAPFSLLCKIVVGSLREIVPLGYIAVFFPNEDFKEVLNTYLNTVAFDLDLIIHSELNSNSIINGTLREYLISLEDGRLYDALMSCEITKEEFYDLSIETKPTNPEE